MCGLIGLSFGTAEYRDFGPARRIESLCGNHRFEALCVTRYELSRVGQQGLKQLSLVGLELVRLQPLAALSTSRNFSAI